MRSASAGVTSSVTTVLGPGVAFGCARLLGARARRQHLHVADDDAGDARLAVCG